MSLQLTRYRASPMTGMLYVGEMHDMVATSDVGPTGPLPAYYRQDLFERITPNSLIAGKEAWKPFQHYKCERSSQDLAQFEMWYATDQYITDIHNLDHGWHKAICRGNPYYGISGFGYDPVGVPPLAGMPQLYNDSLGEEEFVPPPGNLETLKVEAYKAMIPVIKSEVSLINTFIELKESFSVKSIIPAIKRIPALLRSLTAPSQFSRPLRKIVQSTSNDWLQLKFNIAPLISDVYGVYRSLQTVEKRIRTLINGEGRLRRRHFDYRWREFDDLDETASPSSVAGFYPIPRQYGSSSFHRNVTHELSHFHAEMEYNYNYTKYQLEHARVLALLDQLGFNLNPAIIWNALPWSFVIDWIFGVSHWLDQFTQANMEPQINIIRFLWSVKRSRTISLSRSVNSLEGDVPWILTYQRNPVDVYQETSYRREPDRIGISSILSSGVILDNITISAALVFAKNPRKHRRSRL